MFLLSHYIKISKCPAMCHRRKLLNLPSFSISFLFRSIKKYFLLASATVVESFEKDFSTLMELVKETQFTWSTTAVISC